MAILRPHARLPSQLDETLPPTRNLVARMNDGSHEIATSKGMYGRRDVSNRMRFRQPIQLQGIDRH
jgi:hypothetical protein